VPIDITLLARKPFGFETGAGYGTDTGARGLFKWEWRRATRTGHRIDNSYRISQYLDVIDFRYLIPGLSPSTDQFAITGGYTNDRSPERDLNSTTRQLGGSYISGDVLKNWQNTYSLSYQHESYEDLTNIRESTMFLPSVKWEIIRANNRFNADHGYNLSLQVRGASEELGSSTNFAQAELFGKYIHKLTDYHRILMRADIGVTEQQDLDAIPLSLRFYAGGDNSVRGYAYQSLGPTVIDEKGEPVVEGGPYLLVGSIELEQKITGKWFAAVFYDKGNAMYHLNDSLKSGAGFGIRWQSPIGPVRVDLAEALSDRDKPWRLHVNIGPDF